MRHAVMLLLPLLISGQTGPARAGAWVPPQGTGKATLSHIRHRQDIDITLRDLTLTADLEETDTGLLLETGLSRKLTATLKANDARFAFAGVRQQTQSAALGLSLDAPALAVGLLPPFLFGLSKRAMPRARLQRERRASLAVALLHRQSEDHETGSLWTLAMADKITSGRFAVLQEVETSQTRLDEMTESAALYRFSLGFGAVQIGTQAEAFDNGGNFLALNHSTRLGWQPPRADWQVTLARGRRRIAQPFLPGARIHRGRLWFLEIQRKF